MNSTESSLPQEETIDNKSIPSTSTSTKKLKLLGILVAFVSLVAMSGSLYFSEILEYPPCKLCWYQRILMYPIVWITLMSVFVAKDLKFYYTTLLVSVFGILISGYHVALQHGVTEQSFCTGGESCAVDYINWLGFITIPTLSLFAFIIILILSIFSFKVSKQAK